MTDLSRSQWYLGNASGEREGPFSSEEIVDMRLSCCIDDNTPCWRQGMGEWMPLNQVSPLTALIDSRKRLARRRFRTIAAVVAVAVVAVGAGVFGLSRMTASKPADRGTAGSGSSSAAKASAPLPPELKPLQRFVGSWEQQVESKPAEWNPESKSTTGIVKHEWILGGRVLEGQANWTSVGIEGLVLLSYDTEGKEYRQWYFDSNGALPTEGDRGQWNETTRTFTWKGTDRWGNTSTQVHRFSDDDHFEWRLVVKDYSGKVMSDMEGKAKRK